MSAPRIARAVPNIKSDRPAETRDFFTSLLGFEAVMDLGWVVTVASPTNPAAQVTIIGNDDPAAPGISIEVDDVDAVHASALEQGLEIAYSLREEAWGVRRFMLREPGGTTSTCSPIAPADLGRAIPGCPNPPVCCDALLRPSAFNKGARDAGPPSRRMGPHGSRARVHAGGACTPARLGRAPAVPPHSGRAVRPRSADAAAPVRSTRPRARDPARRHHRHARTRPRAGIRSRLPAVQAHPYSLAARLARRTHRRGLPPIDVIQVGDAYAIRDGHHRVLVARARGAVAIDAIVA